MGTGDYPVVLHSHSRRKEPVTILMNEQQHRETLVAEALAHWQERRPLEVGRLLFEALPDEVRPVWAARILRLVLEKSGLSGDSTQKSSPWNWLQRLRPQREMFPYREVGHVLTLAASPEEWHRAHDAFSAVRTQVLRLDQQQRSEGLSSEQDLHLSILSMTELVAKVTYNASNPMGPFDEDSGWWIAACLRGFVDHAWPGDVGFAAVAWSALISTDATPSST